MDISLLHIGIPIVERDIKPFYIDLLGFQEKRSFSINSCDVKDIFCIDKPVAVIQGNCGGLELELFIDNTHKPHLFNHVSLLVSNVDKLSKDAFSKGFRVYTRAKGDSKTYFISDSNGNLFEIKNITKV